MTLSLPDTAVAGDSGHVADHNLIVTALTDLDNDKVSETLVDAKGDMIVATASDTPARLPVGTAGQVLGVDAAATAGVAWRSPGSTNLVTPNQASVETDTTGLVAYGATLARSTAQAAHGSASVAATADAAATFFVITSTGVSPYYTPAIPGRVYTGVASVRSASSARDARAYIQFFDSGFGSLGTYDGLTVSSVSTGWAESVVAYPAPAGTAYVMVGTYVINPAAAEVHYIDCLGLWEGAGGTWAMPGQRIEGLGTWVDESVGRRIYTWDTVNSRWQLTYGDTGWRDISAAATNSTGGGLYIRRHGTTVEITGDLIVTSASTSAYTIPSGFRPLLDAQGSALYRSDGTTLGWEARSDGDLIPYYTGQRQATVMYETNQDWPASLPGAAAATIPYA